jgi:hypothetical protein
MAASPRTERLLQKADEAPMANGQANACPPSVAKWLGCSSTASPKTRTDARENIMIVRPGFPMLAHRVFAILMMSAVAIVAPCAARAQGLTYETARELVPIPPAERGLQTVIAEPWLSLPGVADSEGPAFERDGDLSGSCRPKKLFRVLFQSWLAILSSQ